MSGIELGILHTSSVDPHFTDEEKKAQRCKELSTYVYE